MLGHPRASSIRRKQRLCIGGRHAGHTCTDARDGGKVTGGARPLLMRRVLSKGFASHENLYVLLDD